ncbi:MAG: hypothetical protein WAW88_06055, partial [Nocardioides sp.]
ARTALLVALPLPGVDSATLRVTSDPPGFSLVVEGASPLQLRKALGPVAGPVTVTGDSGIVLIASLPLDG